MPRYTTEEIINQIVNRLPDNSSGAITPAIMRSMLTDMVMSLRGTGAYVAGDAPIVHNFSTSAFQQIPGLYSVGVTRDATEILVDNVAGEFTAMYSADYNVHASFAMEGASNERVIMGIAIDGVVSNYFKSEAQLAGNGSPVEFNLEGVLRVNAGQTIAVWFQAPTQPLALTVNHPAVAVSLIPSRT